MVGLEALKKKNDRAFIHNPIQYKYNGAYTVLNDQNSQCSSLIKKGR